MQQNFNIYIKESFWQAMNIITKTEPFSDLHYRDSNKKFNVKVIKA